MVKHQPSKASREDVVFIRKSTQAQEEGGQRANVEAMLRTHGVHVPERNWFVGTVSRRKVKANADFQRLMEMIESDRVRTVYIESQDRWGTADRTELFSLLGTLRDHNTQLFDLRAKKDLTEKDLANELLAIVNSIKSEKELQDISYRSLRTRVNNFKETGSWPTGTHPFGFGKSCHSADGKLLWVWQPVNRSRGQLFTPDAKGNLIPGQSGLAIPRKAITDRITLVPSNNPASVRAVKTIFDLYVRVGLSRRQIATRLNEEGLQFNGKPFGHTDVTHILENPAYAGDTHFGKNQSGELHTFDARGLIVEKRKGTKRKRETGERLIRENTHEALIDRQTWKLAQKKLEDERSRTSYSPRNPDYYLKQILVCGHCGKGMGGKTWMDPKTRKKTPGYICSTYSRGYIIGVPTECGGHAITHEAAERLLLDKLNELGMEYRTLGSGAAETNLQARLEKLGVCEEELLRQWQLWIQQGVDAFAGYLTETHGIDYPELPRLRRLALRFYCEEDVGGTSLSRYAESLSELREAITAAEGRAVEAARREVAALRERHKKFTLRWAEASEDMQSVLKAEIEQLAEQIREWEPRTVALTARLESLYLAETARHEEREKLLQEWPALQAREKGEALRKLFNTVTLFWDRTWHPASKRPTRPRKTDSPGRYSYTLRRKDIAWQFASTDLGSCW